MNTTADQLAAALRLCIEAFDQMADGATFDQALERTGCVNAATGVLATYSTQPATEPPRVCIRMEGGLVQSVFSDVPMNFIGIDYDTDGADDDEVFPMPQGDGRTSDCFLSQYPADVMPEEVARIVAAIEAHEAAAVEEEA